MRFLTDLGLKKSHFTNGFAYFDQISHTEILAALKNGAFYDVTIMNNVLTINALMKFPELMTFGKINEAGLMLFEGVVGFPSDAKCVEFACNLSEGSKRHSVGTNKVFIEW